MSLRLEMLEAARLAPRLLGESTALVTGFLQGQRHADGGFQDRSGRSDLYYTVFGLESLTALNAAPAAEPVLAYLDRFGDGQDLDFVHLCCLARCWRLVGEWGKPCSTPSDWPDRRAALAGRLERFRSGDGGFNPVAASPFGTSYGCFLGLAAFQDLDIPLANASGLATCLQALALSDGAWANERGLPTGSTTATAAAVAVLRHLDQPIPPGTARWLQARLHPQGGFCAAPHAPLPDLLSTATALHTLATLGIPVRDFREACLDFMDSLWTNAGSFHGHWADEHLDCEYTFYALLALGHLSL